MKTIPLTQGKVALVDDDDFECLSAFKWFAFKAGDYFYAARNIRNANGKYVRLPMHRMIMEPDKGLVVDHIDFNGMNNCRSNLQILTIGKNRGRTRPRKNTTSKFKGVSYSKTNKKWIAQIKHNNRRIYLGSYENELDAARDYDMVATRLNGAGAVLNSVHFPEIAF